MKYGIFLAEFYEIFGEIARLKCETILCKMIKWRTKYKICKKQRNQIEKRFRVAHLKQQN